MSTSSRKVRPKKISVIISGMPSVGKTTAANEIAKRFQLKHIAGGDMLKEIARERGYKVSGPDWWDKPEGMAFMAERKNDPEFDKEVDRKLAEHLKSGGVVMTSYSMPWLAKDDSIKLWFRASQKTRASRLAGRDSISKSKALQIIRKRDLENKRLYKKLYGIRFGDDLSPFDFVLNTEKMSATEVADSSCKIVSQIAKERALQSPLC